MQLARSRKSEQSPQPSINHVDGTKPDDVSLTSDLKRIPRVAMRVSRQGRTQKKLSGRERIVRRQIELGGHSAGSSRSTRLDPHALPVHFTAEDAVADERVRHVELHRERVILRRALQGMRIALNVPVKAFRGVSIRLVAQTRERAAGVAVYLEHLDPALSIELYAAENTDDIVAEWQCWSRVLGLPQLVAASDGGFHTPFPQIGAVRHKEPTQRRRRRSAVARRRPRFLARRHAGVARIIPLVHRGEREIIARN
jgi:hypothetical protein